MTTTPAPEWAYVPYQALEGNEFGDQYWTGGKKYTWTPSGIDGDDGGYWKEEDLPPFADPTSAVTSSDLPKRLAALEAEIAVLKEALAELS